MACESKDVAVQAQIAAEAAETSANSSANQSQAIWNDFQERYMGSYPSAPTATGEGAMYWNSSSNALFVWDGTSWVAAPSGFNEFTPFLATGTTFARNLVTREADVVNVLDFGTTQSDIANAISQGEYVFFPAGTYNINYTSTKCFQIPANTVIEGAGVGITRLVFTASGSAIAYSELFSMLGENITIKNLTIQIIEVPMQQIVAVRHNQSKLNLENIEFIGGMTDNGATVNSTSYAVSASTSGTQNDLNVVGCSFTRFSYVFLKTNASTATNKRINIIGNKFYENYAEDCSFNTPNGTISELVIAKNSFYSPKIISPLFKIAIGLASAQNVVIDSNIIVGQFGLNQVGAIHIEENSKNVNVTNNVVLNSGSGAHGIILLWNNVSGTGYSPQNINICNNVFSYIGTASGSNAYGILLNNLAGGDPNNIIIDANNIKNYEFGIGSGLADNENVIVSNNLIEVCVNGILANGGGISFEANATSQCTNGIKMGSGPTTAIYGHRFLNCTTNYSGTAGQRPIVLVNPTFEFALYTNGAGATVNLAIGPIGPSDRCYGNFITSVSTTTSATNSIARIDQTSWNGTTFTNTPLSVYQPGALTAIPANNTGVLSIRTFAASQQTSVRVQTSLNGMISTVS